MQKITGFSGKDIPVSDEWFAANITAFPGIEKLDYAQVRGTITGLHRKHDARVEAIRFGALPPDAPLLTDHELALISACDGILNMNARFVALNGRDLRALYGEHVGMDQINLSNWRPDTCGCEHRFLWRLDHGGKDQPERVHYGHTIVKNCPEHAHINDPAAHHDEIVAKNSHKNHTVNLIHALPGVPPGSCEWSYDENKVLVVTNKAIPPEQHAEVMKAIADHPVASTRPVRIG